MKKEFVVVISRIKFKHQGDVHLTDMDVAIVETEQSDSKKKNEH